MSTLRGALIRTCSRGCCVSPCSRSQLPPASNITTSTSWITIRSDIWWGYGNSGVFAFDVAANTGSARAGTIRAAGFIFTVRQFGASDAPPVTGDAVPSLASLDTITLNALREFAAPGGSLAVNYQGRLVYARGFGYSDLVSLDPVQPDTGFRLASVSKLLTMAAISKLEQEGKLSPATKVFSVLTDIAPPGRLTVVDNRWYDITVDQLINHTAGFLRVPVDCALNYDYRVTATGLLNQAMPGDNTSVIRYAMSRSLDCKPGSPPNPCPDCYSNFGYQILGRLIEKVTGMTYEDYIRNVILVDAGVNRARAARSWPEQAAPGEAAYYVNPTEMWADSVFGERPGPTLFTYGAYPFEQMDSFGGMSANTMDVLRFYNK